MSIAERAFLPTFEERFEGASLAGPLISVILPVFQGERLIDGAINSALAQTWANIELIVVDDGSTDGTAERVRAFADPRIQLIVQENAGTGAARNAALEIARGDFVAFLDCDDRWFPEKLSAELDVLLEAPSAIGIAYSSYYAVDDRGRLLNRAPSRLMSGNAFDLLIDGENFLLPSVCLFDRRIFDAVGVFNPGSYNEDHEFILRVVKRFPIFPTGRHLVVYRQSTSGKCRSILADFDRARAVELATLEFLNDSLTPSERARLRENALRSLAFRFLMYGFERHARRLIREMDVRRLRVGKKGWLAFFFAFTGVNALLAARLSIQTAHILLVQPAWGRYLRRHSIELRYE